MARKPGQTREATRAAIIAASERVFTSEGFAGASLSMIAKEAGITKSLIHYHFTSKEALWQEIKESRFADFALAQDKIFAMGGPAREFLTNCFTTYFEFLRDHPEFLRLMWWMQAEYGQSLHPGLDTKVGETMRGLVDRGIEATRELQKNGDIRQDLEARFIFAAFLGLLRHWFVARQDFRLSEEGEEQRETDERYLANTISIFLDGVMVKRI
ncbi:MAG: hypothetical protein A2289_05780 [Deltaproteobacteria bacterium RIFOXYA12_FULL_58_15]|nr:MAG: hypothetical protein A2289_05780 [Deltaproteobacteria bacterium RIFOXYA12_FULL_58_15]